MFVNGHAGNTLRFIRTVLSIKTHRPFRIRQPQLDPQSVEGASCAETDKQNVSLVTTSNRAAILFETLRLYE